MGATKRAQYTEELLELADLFKVLGHPARLSIVQNLLKDEELNCKELKKKIPLSQSTISQHLKLLYLHGVVGYRVESNSSYYSVNEIMIVKCLKCLKEIKSKLKSEENSLVVSYFSSHYKNTTGIRVVN